MSRWVVLVRLAALAGALSCCDAPAEDTTAHDAGDVGGPEVMCSPLPPSHIAVVFQVELNEGNGWTSVYQGNTCHDVRTGMLVLLSYTKRWLYTGEFDGNTYDKAYFGDNETLVQRLSDTNVEMAEVVPAQ